MSFLLAAILILSGTALVYSQDCNSATDLKASGSDDPVGTKVDGGMLYGKAIDPTSEVISYSDFLSKMDELNGKDVILKGTVADVCQAMGCWLTLSADGKTTRIKTDHEFFLPKDIAGREAIVAGKFVISEISEEDARHFNDESKNPTVKSEDIKGPQKAFEMSATGVVVLDAGSK
ncbi:MAG: DUF4920 domain-containing protein [Ignavibacteria bacterium]|nr:DUF4920 domain-containing protein [Ignavibacteria bacterium]